MIRQLDDRTLVSGQIAPARGRRAGGAGRHHAGQQPARRRGAGPAARCGHRGGRRSRRASPTASCRSSAASARRTSRRCRKRLREAEGGKMLAFCRSGTRSALACALAQREEGASRRGSRPAADRSRLRLRPDRAPALGLRTRATAGAPSSRSSSSTIRRTGTTSAAVEIVDLAYRTTTASTPSLSR